MASRTRSRYTGNHIFPGYVDTTYSKATGLPISTQYGSASTAYSYYEWMSDWTSPPPYPDHNMNKHKVGYDHVWSHSGSNVIRETATTFVVREWNGTSWLGKFSCASATGNPPVVDWAFWRTKALANINPNRPDVDIPVGLVELRDLPRMLKHMGDLLKLGRSPSVLNKFRTLLPESILNWNFGWAPLISDIKDLLRFQELVNQRLEYLKAIESGRRIKRGLGQRSYVPSTAVSNYQVPYPYAPGGYLLKADRISSTLEKGWVVAKLSLLTPLPESDRAQKLLAARAVYGLDISPATFWNLIPWSWLIDWFTNTGDLIDLTRNMIKYHVDSMNVMVKQTTTATWRVTHDPVSINYFPGSAVRVDKKRDVTVNPTARFTFKPFIDGRQASILASLAVVAALKGRKVAR